MEDSFFFSNTLQNYLFYGVNIQTTFGLVSLIMGFASLCFLWEGLRVAQLHVINAHKVFCCKEFISSKDRLISMGVQTLLYVLAMLIGYIIMLSIMTFNAWFLVSGIIGSAIGFWCFGYLNQTLQILLIPKCAKHNKTCDKYNLTSPDEPTDSGEICANSVLLDGAMAPVTCHGSRPSTNCHRSANHDDTTVLIGQDASGTEEGSLVDQYVSGLTSDNKFSISADVHNATNAV